MLNPLQEGARPAGDRLRGIQPGADIELALDLVKDGDRKGLLECSKLLRCIPGRRLVVRGRWQGQDVLAKIFLQGRRMARQVSRELNGYHRLAAAGIATPRLLFEGRVDDDPTRVILFEFVCDARSGDLVWQRHSNIGRRRMLQRLIDTLARQHEAGLWQRDLHLDNFLLGESVVWTLDTADIQYRRGGLGRTRSLQNLGLLFAQLYPGFDRWQSPLLRRYCSMRGWDVPVDTEMQNIVRRWRNRRKRIVLEKAFRRCSSLLCETTWKRRLILDRNCDSAEFRRALAALDQVIQRGQMLKPGNTCTVARIQVDSLDLVVKRYNLKNRWHALRRAFRPSRAAICWRNAHLLSFYGISTPSPVALVESRWGPVRRQAYFLTRAVDGGDALDVLASTHPADAGARRLAARIVRCIDRMHSLNIVHGDLKGTNILVAGQQPVLIDLDAMKQYACAWTARRGVARDRRRFLRNWEASPFRGLFYSLWNRDA